MLSYLMALVFKSKNKKKSNGIRSGDLGGHMIDLLSIHLPQKMLFK